jgi:hypothetical protein
MEHTVNPEEGSWGIKQKTMSPSPSVHRGRGGKIVSTGADLTISNNVVKGNHLT